MSTQVFNSSPVINTDSFSPVLSPVGNTNVSNLNQVVSPIPVIPTVTSIQTPVETMSSLPESIVPEIVPETGMKKMNIKMALIVFVVFAIVTILIMGYLAKNYQDTQDSLNTSAWNAFPVAGAVLLFLAILISSYATFKGFSTAQGYDKNLIMICYVAILILFIIAFTLFWRKGNYSGAFYVSLVIVALSILLSYFSWKSDKIGGYGQLPLFIMSVVAACYFYDITSKNHNNCGEIDGITCVDESNTSSSKKEDC